MASASRIERERGSRRLAFSSETVACAGIPPRRCVRPCWNRSYVSLIGQSLLVYECGEVWGTRRFPTFSARRGHVGETWHPPRERAEGQRRSSLPAAQRAERDEPA